MGILTILRYRGYMSLIPDITLPTPSDLGSLLGLRAAPASNSATRSFFGLVPWGVESASTDAIGTPLPPTFQTIFGQSAFFPAMALKGELWDKLVNYRLVVFDTVENRIVNGKLSD